VQEGWRISKGRPQCSYCGAEFADNGVFYSCLTDEEGELVREDFCPACWEKFRTQPYFCHWQSRRSVGEKKRTVDTSLMIEFFDRLEGAETQEKRIFRFVLALYLMRRKELKLRDMRREGGHEVMVFTRRAGGGAVEVANPELSEEQIEAASEQLTALLDAGLED
jgi:hypothetical protein